VGRLWCKQCWICAVLWRPFWKCRPIENFRCQESFRDIIIYPHMKCRWNWTISKWPPQFCTNSTLSDFNAISYVGRLWCPELIPDIDKFLLVAIFKKPFWKWQPVEIVQCRNQNRDIIIYPHIKFWWYRTMLNFCVLWWPFWKWRPVEIFQCWKSIRDITIYPHIKFYF
jgi:hypothetical protein